MFLRIEAHEYAQNAELIEGYLRLRKRVFLDELGWDVEVAGDIERDRYDDCRPAYLLWTDDARTKVYAGLRLLPTTGPTLLHDVFSRTFGAEVDLIDPAVWECTRLCFDHELLRLDLDVSGVEAMTTMIAFAHEVADDAGISTLVSNYEPHHRRIYERAGATFTEIGRADGYGRRAVCCGLFEVDWKSLTTIRSTLGLGRLQSERFENRTADRQPALAGTMAAVHSGTFRPAVYA